MLLVLPTGPALAADDALEPSRIATMDIKALSAFVDVITGSVGQDSIRLRGFASSKSCLELLRAANSFSLAYGYLAAVETRGQAIGGDPALALRARVVQSRVLVFAARARAEEFLNRTCRDFAVPADSAADPRYQTPGRLSDADYTTALIEARDATDANLAFAILAAQSKQCARISSTLEAVALLVPYLDKMAADVESRPYSFGPRASRRGLLQSRNQLVGAANRIAGEFTPTCIPEKGLSAPANQ